MIIERKMWDDMRQALSGIAMPLMAHQQVQNILSNVEQASSQLEGTREASEAAGPAIVQKRNGTDKPAGNHGG